ncbi:hypothetical protein WA158_002215 [Blastocystis sp. Blastoise]
MNGKNTVTLVFLSGKTLQTTVESINKYPKSKLSKTLESLRPSSKECTLIINEDSDSFNYIVQYLNDEPIHVESLLLHTSFSILLLLRKYDLLDTSLYSQIISQIQKNTLNYYIQKYHIFIKFAHNSILSNPLDLSITQCQLLLKSCSITDEDLMVLLSFFINMNNKCECILFYECSFTKRNVETLISFIQSTNNTSKFLSFINPMIESSMMNQFRKVFPFSINQFSSM